MVFDVTKKVRGPSWMSSRFVLREGRAMRGIYNIAGVGSIGLCALRLAARGPAAQGRVVICGSAARLKPCPDTCDAAWMRDRKAET